MWINGVVTEHNWVGEFCLLTLKTEKPEPTQIKIPAVLLVGFEIIHGQEWSVECTDGGRPKSLFNRVTREKRPVKMEKK